MDQFTLDEVVAFAKRRGFVYPSAEIYGGLANSYDFGPMGALLLKSLRALWWKKMVYSRTDVLPLEAGIISHADVWKASGHVSSFADAMIDCKECHTRMRADHLIEDFFVAHPPADGSEVKVEGKSTDEFSAMIAEHHILCPKCGKFSWTEVRKFNLLFPVKMGILEGEQSLAYLRGETAQGMFYLFKSVLDSVRVRLPFGLAQMGKSFRNEITKGNFIFRTLEFEQAEIEYFFNPKTHDWKALFEDWQKRMNSFVVDDLGVNADRVRWREHSEEERSFYSLRTVDLEYNFPFGFKEVWGLAYRTDYDLHAQMKHSGADLRYMDPYTNEKFVPHVIEPAVGVTRLFLVLLCDALKKMDDGRVIFALPKTLAPYRVAVFPLLSNKEELVKKAREVYDSLSQDMMVAWDDRGNIGKRYLSQDEIGTPSCVTVDFQTLEDNTVTVRDRDTTTQIRISIDELKGAV